MGAKDLLRNAHMSGKIKKNETVSPAIKKGENITPTINSPSKETDSKIPTAIRQVKRDDVNISEYGIKPDITNFQLYNYELSEMLTLFSRNNKKNGGNPITKSQLMEIILGFAFYDLNLKPNGFQNAQELLDFLRKQIK